MTGLPLLLSRALALALGQLADPRILRVFAKSGLVTLAILFTLWAALMALVPAVLARFAGTGDTYFVVLTGLVGLLAAWFAFRLVALAVLQFFADEVVRAVEARHYPEAADAARDVPFAAELAAGGKGLLRALAVNALALPVAGALLITGVGAPLVLWAANAWLLGRELTEMVWLRHRTPDTAALPVGRGTRFALGGVVAALLAVPIVNLLAPVLGAAAATHLVHGRRP